MKPLFSILAAAAVALAAGAAQAQPDGRSAASPPGSYLDSCRDVSTYGYGEDATVTARCRDERGHWRAASLRIGRCREIENRDGRLVCAEGGRDRDRPPWAEGDRDRPAFDGGGRPGYGRNSITLFSAPDFGGRPFETQGEITNLPKQYNDRAMSLRIQGRGVWQVCTDSDFRGRCQVFDRDVRDLREFGFGEAISSMRPVR